MKQMLSLKISINIEQRKKLQNLFDIWAVDVPCSVNEIQDLYY